METFSALLAICAWNSPVPGEFPAQRPVTRSFDVFFDLRLNQRLSKQSWGWWLETLSRPLWRHRNMSHLLGVEYTLQWRDMSAIHCTDVIMVAMASQITSLTSVYSSVYSGAHQRNHQSSPAFVWGIHRWQVNSPYIWSVTRKMFPFVNVIMYFWNRRKIDFFQQFVSM